MYIYIYSYTYKLYMYITYISTSCNIYIYEQGMNIHTCLMLVDPGGKALGPDLVIQRDRATDAIPLTLNWALGQQHVSIDPVLYQVRIPKDLGCIFQITIGGLQSKRHN